MLEIKNAGDFAVERGDRECVSVTDNIVRIKSSNPVMLIAKKLIPVKADKTYTVSGKFRKSPGAADNTKFWFGFVTYNGRGLRIPAQAVNFTPDSLTELSAAALKGDTQLTVKDASKWRKNSKNEVAAFKAKADSSDIPNYNTSSAVKNIEPKDGKWILTLSKPLDRAFPAGTLIRNHRYGGTYLYLLSGKIAPAQWQDFSFTLKGDAGLQGIADGKWWAGTQRAKLFILTVSGGADIEFSNIVLDVTD